MSSSKREIHPIVQAQRRRAKQATAAFVKCISDGASSLICDCLNELELTGETTNAFRAVAKIAHVSEEFKNSFLDIWLASGSSIRTEVHEARSLRDALRVLLPRYTGPGLTLFRGDSAHSRKRRSYGMSWSESIDVARAFALGEWRACQGGSVLLRCYAPPEAILCKVPDDRDIYEEKEIIVDTRLLGHIDAIERFEHVPIEQLLMAASQSPD